MTAKKTLTTQERNYARGFRKPAKLALRAGRLTWAGAGAVSLALFGLVVAQLDASSLAAAFDGISLTLVGVGVALFMVEGLFGAFRTHLIAGWRGGFLTAMRVTAWHGVWLIALPMRLGEVAWVVAMQRAYGWNVATATACAVMQRLLDLAVVAACLFVTLPATLGLHEDRPFAFFALAGVVCLLALIGLMTLPIWLRLAAGILLRTGRPRGRRRLMRHLHQARRWLEDVRQRRVMLRCIVPTVLIWTAVIAAYWSLCQAAGLDLAVAELGFATAGSNLVAALPVQSVGGIGLLEAGFTGLVAWLGAPAGTAALVALAVRFALIAEAGLFWLIVTVASPIANRIEIEPKVL